MQEQQDKPPPGRQPIVRVRRLLVIVILTYLGVCLMVAVFQTRMIYFPDRGYPRTPADAGLSFENPTLTTADGLAIAAWYVPHPRPSGTILFCHGNAGNISDRIESIKLLHILGYNVLIFDYRGFGQSEGRPGEAGTYLDADAAWRYLIEVRGEAPQSVVLFGRSLGGAVAVELATRHAPGALVVESTFTSLTDIAGLHYPLFPVRLLLRHRYNSIDKIGPINCPKLFIHGVDDELIPFANGRELFAAAPPPKEFIATPGGHNTSGFAYSLEYTEKLGEFLGRALGQGAE